jgi:hypothetical protein
MTRVDSNPVLPTRLNRSNLLSRDGLQVESYPSSCMLFGKATRASGEILTCSLIGTASQQTLTGHYWGRMRSSLTVRVPEKVNPLCQVQSVIFTEYRTKSRSLRSLPSLMASRPRHWNSLKERESRGETLGLRRLEEHIKY